MKKFNQKTLYLETRIINLKIVVLISFFYALSIFGQNTNAQDFSNTKKLNEQLIDEVNKIRKKAKVDSLENNNALESAAKDHAIYMMQKGKLTHHQRGNRLKYAPKNRADFYDSGFDIIGENIQQIHVSHIYEELQKNKKIDDPYQALALLLTENWRKSPPHYTNMISPNYISTYTTIEIDEDGNIYACQLFGGSEYVKFYKKQRKPVDYKPVKEKKCKRKNAGGHVRVDENGTILYVADSKKDTGFRWAWPWTEGIAADIVLKSQYPCEGNNNYNPEPGVRGIPLEPIYKKDFGKIGLWSKNKVAIPLGKVPDYIDEPYEVNLTIISRKRTCGNKSFNRIVSDVEIGLNLKLEVPERSPYKVERTDSIVSEKVFFEKSGVTVTDSLNFTAPKIMEPFHLDSTVLIGYASIEGDFERNKRLFEQRTKNVKSILVDKGFTDSLIIETALENFADFRKDIKHSLFEEWLSLDDQNLKDKASERPISDSLESILSKHRYVEIQHFFSLKDSTIYTSEELERAYFKALRKNNPKEAEEVQLKLIQLVKLGHAEFSKKLYDSIPKERNFADVKYTFDLYQFTIQQKKDFTQAVKNFMDSLSVLLELDPKNKKAHSALAYFESMKILQQGNPNIIQDHFIHIAESNLLEREFQARILLELAISNDLIIYYNELEHPYLVDEVPNHIRQAQPSTSELFGLSAYFNFFDYNQFAFDLVKRTYMKTEDPEELKYFLNLVLFARLDLKENQKLRYFSSIASKIPEHFCTFFIDNSINFQLFDDLNYKIIYCKTCTKE